MSIQQVDGTEGVYYLDTQMFGHPGRGASYLLTGDETAIVDPGLSTGVDRIDAALDSVGIDYADVDRIFLTHVHLDHAGGAGELAARCENAEVVCHDFGVGFLSDEDTLEKLIASVHEAVGDLADRYGTARPIPEDRFRVVEGGETIVHGNRRIEVIHAPGHAPHQVCFYDETNALLFTADECGEYVEGNLYATTPPPNFDLEKNLATLDRLDNLEVDTYLYPHFGPVDGSVDVVDEYADVLQEWVDDVRSVAGECESTEDVVATFLERDHPYYDIWDRQLVDETIRMNVVGTLQYLEE